MSYKCYLFDELMPQTPAKLSVKISGKNTTITLLNEGEINFLRAPGLTEITLPLVFPMLSAEKRPDYYLALLERAKTQKLTTQFIMTRTTPDGQLLFDTNIKVSIEDYSIDESATNGLDVSSTVKLKQYRDYSTRTITIKNVLERIENNAVRKKVLLVRSPRPAATAPRVKTYTVKSGDTLWSIAKKIYGEGAKYLSVLDANRGRIVDPNNIEAGLVLIIP